MTKTDVILITLINAEASTPEEFAGIMLKYGGEGFKYAYLHEEFDPEMFLTDSSIDFDEYYDEMQDVGETIKEMKHKGVMQYELSDGTTLLLLKD